MFDRTNREKSREKEEFSNGEREREGYKRETEMKGRLLINEVLRGCQPSTTFLSYTLLEYIFIVVHTQCIVILVLTNSLSTGAHS